MCSGFGSVINAALQHAFGSASTNPLLQQTAHVTCTWRASAFICYVSCQALQRRMLPISADSGLLCAQGSQTFTVFVTEQPGAEAAEEVVSGQEYLTLAPEDAAALAAELNCAFAAALVSAAGQETSELFGLRIEASDSRVASQSTQ